MDIQDSRLFMEIGINDSGNLEIVDNTPYERWIQDNILDGDHVVFERILKITSDDLDFETVWESFNSADTVYKLKSDKEVELPEDNYYRYQKMLIPLENHDGNQRLFVRGDSINGFRMIFIDNNNIEHLVDFDEAFDYINNVNTGNAFWFDDDIFTIYNLIKCYVMTEKQRIANWLKNNCKADCDVISTTNTNADILMAAVYVLTYLISKKQFVEAFRLLNGLHTCDGLCKDFVDDIKGCGCGKLV